MYTSLKFNRSGAPVKRQTLHGKNYIVAPMAMITEGVHNGSGGPLLYREEECKKAVQAWNMKPIVVYHPTINGMGVSACDPDILESQQVGMVMNARWAGGKLRADAWIEEERAALVDNRVIEALDECKIMEVSTGLFTDNVGSAGVWNGKDYVAEAVNHQPDHLALLPDQIGACSIADGAGLLQTNAMSHGNLYTALSKALTGRHGGDGVEGPWVVDVFDGYLVYDGMDGKLYKHTYTNTKDKVELTGEPMEVTRVTDYKPVKEGLLGNRAATMAKVYAALTGNYSPGQPRQADGKWGTGGGAAMGADKGGTGGSGGAGSPLNGWDVGGGGTGTQTRYTKDINGTTYNVKPGLHGWVAQTGGKTVATENDYAGAMKAAHKHAETKVTGNEAQKTDKKKGTKMDKKMIVSALIANTLAIFNEEDRDTLMALDEASLTKLNDQFNKKDEVVEEAEAPVENAARGTLTTEQYIANAPDGIRDVLINALATQEAQKAECIKTITANASNKFTKEWLATRPLAELQGMAALAVAPVANAAPVAPVPMFAGQATPAAAPVANASGSGGPLLMPTMEFGPAAN